MCWAVLALLVMAVAACWFLRGRKPPATPAPGTAAKPISAEPKKIWGKKFMIAPGRMPCEQAIDLAGKSFAIDKAPPLPLAGCTVASCACRYEPLAERRTSQERRNGHERRGEIRFDPDKQERRSCKDRRQDTYHWDSGV
jgi:hypothetical protein